MQRQHVIPLVAFTRLYNPLCPSVGLPSGNTIYHRPRPAARDFGSRVSAVSGLVNQKFAKISGGKEAIQKNETLLIIFSPY